MDPTPTSQDTPIISRNPGGTKTDNRILTDLTFPTQNTPIFDLNGSKDDNRNLNRDSNSIGTQIMIIIMTKI